MSRLVRRQGQQIDNAETEWRRLEEDKRLQKERRDEEERRKYGVEYTKNIPKCYLHRMREILTDPFVLRRRA